jgi:CheY-like chemotaxis protein
MAILMLTADLMFASRVSGAAARLGTTMQTAATPEMLLEWLAAAEPGALVVLDLTMRNFDPRHWVPLVRQAENPPGAIFAYGPHVQDALLAAATEAGCDAVFTRGQFNARMDEILSS